jgi:predicted nucleic acid-binding protein
VVKALLDTNILIDFLRGIPAARDEMNRHQDKAISIVTWMEVIAGAPAHTDRITKREGAAPLPSPFGTSRLCRPRVAATWTTTSPMPPPRGH